MKKTKVKVNEKLLKRQEDYKPIINDLTALVKGIFKRSKDEDEDNENRSFYKSWKGKKEEDKKKSNKYTPWEIISFITIGLTLGNLIFLIYSYIDALSNLRKTVTGLNIIYAVAMIVIPIAVWVRSTNEDFFAFRQRKRLFFYLTVANALAILAQPIYNMIRGFLVPILARWPINPLMTQRKVILLCYIGVYAGFFFATYFIWLQLEPLLMSKMIQRQIDIFKLRHIIDDRKDAEYLYDVKSIYNLETGKPIVIKEQDRYIHTCINGASGTGKTSSIFMSVIRDDLDKKMMNRELREAALLKMVLDKKAVIEGPLRKFSEYSIVAVGKDKKTKEANEKEIKDIRKKYKDCGMTIMAPNNDLIVNIIRLCKARSINVNVIDPLNNYSNQFSNVKDVGIAPFYIPLGLDEETRLEFIISAAEAFSDSIIAINDMSGNGDAYFKGVSESVCYNVACIVMLCRNIQNEQTTIDDVQACINDFSLIKDYVAVIKSNYGILEDEGRTEEKKNTGAISIDNIADKINKISQNQSTINREESKRNFEKCPYRSQLAFVEKELIGKGEEKMFDQARGLRNLINHSVQNLNVKRLLSASQRNEANEDGIAAIDLDEILKENEITLVNTAKNISPAASSFIGLFFLLNLTKAMLRRPNDTRTPHFLWVDEASGYCHPVYEDFISYMRQFGVACTFTFQTLSQLTKSPATAYLKDVFLGAGTHIVFGRQSPEEMKLYSDMGGADIQQTEVKTESGTSIFEQNTNMSHSVRVMEELKNNLEMSDIRTTDFQELTLITTNGGRVMNGKKARVFFVRQDAYDKQDTSLVDWEAVAPEAFHIQDESEEVTEKQEQELKKSLEDNNLDKSIANVITTTEDFTYDDEGEIFLSSGVDEEADEEEEESTQEETSNEISLRDIGSKKEESVTVSEPEPEEDIADALGNLSMEDIFKLNRG